MLFRRNTKPSCAYCKHGMTMGFGEIACSKRGIMSVEGKCNLFCYEPTKRKPEYSRKTKPVKIPGEDFNIQTTGDSAGDLPVELPPD